MSERKNSEENDGEKKEDGAKSLHDLVKQFCEQAAKFLERQETLSVTVRGDGARRRYEVFEENLELPARIPEKRADLSCQAEARRSLVELVRMRSLQRDGRPLSITSSVSSCSSSGYASVASNWSTTTLDLERQLSEARAQNEFLLEEIRQMREGEPVQEARFALERRTAVRRKEAPGALTPISEKSTPSPQDATPSNLHPTVDHDFEERFQSLGARIRRMRELVRLVRQSGASLEEVLRQVEGKLEDLERAWKESEEGTAPLDLLSGLALIEELVKGVEEALEDPLGKGHMFQ
uniref:Uncharacterized protein n=1 Tax=Steinernema glaseri TaxID=37863 RepID=A0A1I7Z9Y5_9BILA